VVVVAVPRRDRALDGPAEKPERANAGGLAGAATNETEVPRETARDDRVAFAGSVERREIIAASLPP
jgi:hypothetical protein